MTDRPKRVLRKTPPPPTICGVSTSASHDDLLDEHNPVFVSTDFIRTVMRAVEVISTENVVDTRFNDFEDCDWLNNSLLDWE
ncbi:hypothetical protein T484DRAFT_1920727 [Baffinella frigidus]|nr:hypothetical protein T484DRAFT_1920727 [Cryptophyta sp. CCMP2293]